jgi:hypothetical protein
MVRACLHSTAVVLISAVVGRAGDLSVVSVEPAAHTMTALRDTPITVHFDRPVIRSSITPPGRFWAFGRWSGTVTGSFAFDDSDRTVRLLADHPLSAGESVTVYLSDDIEGTDGTNLRPAGFSFQFGIRPRAGRLDFAEIDRRTTRTTPSVGSRAYGGIASDLNRDRWLDLTIVNEDTADLRVFLNRGDGTGLFHAFLQPTFPVGPRASPSEPSDFNRDGNVDICVANINANTVSILLGNGDGTYQPQQAVTVGVAPRGIAVLDAEGDGDVDIVNTNSTSSNMSILFNDGTGVFSGPSFFEGGGINEWALGSADMNDDGILDLVIGAIGSDRVIVALGNGNGTFTNAFSRDCGGDVWMIALGDVNGDGTDDVAVANGGSDNGAILLNEGDGLLSAAQVYPTDPFTLATDLGDLDGDGDLDWVTSSFFGDWILFENDGAGAFTENQRFPATASSSCSLAMDFDNDGDLDLALIDETADEVILMQQQGPFIPALSTVGAVAFGLLLLAAGAVIARRSARGTDVRRWEER